MKRTHSNSCYLLRGSKRDEIENKHIDFVSLIVFQFLGWVVGFIGFHFVVNFIAFTCILNTFLCIN